MNIAAACRSCVIYIGGWGVKTEICQKGGGHPYHTPRNISAKNERVCHTISRLKCGIRRTPSPLFGSPRNMWRDIFHMVK